MILPFNILIILLSLAGTIAIPSAPAENACNSDGRVEKFNGGQLEFFNVDYCPYNFEMTKGRGVLTMTSECGTRLSSKEYFTSGYFEARLTIADSPGVVTAFILRSDDTQEKSDEVDFEFVGGRANWTELNYFIDSKPDHTRVLHYNQNYNAAKSWIKPAISWNSTHIRWFINGKLLRTLVKGEGDGLFPNKPMRPQLGIWDGTNTSGWAGTVDHSKGPFKVNVDYLHMEAYCPQE